MKLTFEFKCRRTRRSKVLDEPEDAQQIEENIDEVEQQLEHGENACCAHAAGATASVDKYSLMDCAK